MIAVLLLVFGLTPACIFPVSADIPVYPNFDPQKAIGKWHPIGMASKLPGLAEHDQKISPMDHTVEVSDGDMKLTANYMSDGHCKEASFLLKHTDKPGVFKFPARGSKLGDDIKEKFKKLALEQKYPEAHIKYFGNVEQCAPKAA
ncbi:secretory 4-like [Podarcis lilfordi]|uniref:Secretory 4-like n=1 Tax=Podarcis lilfordi TaxID=74358 RepID=A0AA35P025_9SAUR|nr:secretory 4-like [Podarcis lilfordi]